MTRSMMHEQFYCCGAFNAPAMGISAGWVALKDSLAARQTVVDDLNDTALVFSGECFAPSESAVKLHGDGQTHRAAWLLELYNKEGDDVFSKLNGLFSGLLIDRRRKSAFLFNDRYGIERLYVHETEDATYFASEAKALLRVLPQLRAFDEEGVAQYLAVGCTMGSQTLFQGISLMLGASLWRFEPGRCHKTRYFTPTEWENQEPLSAEDFEIEFDKTFRRVLPRYFDSVPSLGVSLTGGLDTRMIMACRPESRRNPVCYTFGGPCGETRDTVLARRVADGCGLEHHMLRLGPDFLAEFPSYADRTVNATDGCCGVFGSHEIYLNKQARELATTRLTGNFGSEVLRSMSTFKPINLSRKLLNPDFAPHRECAQQMLAGSSEHPVTFAAFKEIPWNLFSSLAVGRSQLTFRTPYLDNELVKLAYRAPAHLRITPFPALRLIKKNNPALSKIPTDRGLVGDKPSILRWLKHFLSEAAFKFEYHTNEGLPNALSSLEPLLKPLGAVASAFGKHKYLYYRSWLRTELAAYVCAAVDRAVQQESPFWNTAFIPHLAKAHIDGSGNYLRELNAVLTLESIERLLFGNYPSSNEVARSVAEVVAA
jgi:asparagine synthase (glutamine-hydrolysing)